MGVSISQQEYDQLKEKASGGIAGAAGQLVGTAVAAASPINRGYRKELRSDLKRLRDNDLGLSDAGRQQYAADAARQTGAAQQVQNAELSRLVKSNPAMGGKALQAQGDIAEAGALGRSAASNQANQISTQLAQVRRDKIMGQTANRAMQNLATGSQMGQDIGRLGKKVAGSVGGGGTGGFTQARSAVLG